MAALNAQTAVQFQQYAAQQYPNSPEQQIGLIRQLQEQHYQQYMQQLYQVQLAQQQVGCIHCPMDRHSCMLNSAALNNQIIDLKYPNACKICHMLISKIKAEVNVPHFNR